MKRLVFTDEKDFPYEVARNRQNDRVYGRKKKIISQHKIVPWNLKVYQENNEKTQEVKMNAI